MEGLLSPAALSREIEALTAGYYLADAHDLIEEGLGLFRPPTKISTVEWAEKYRKFRTTEGGALVPYDRLRTPYNIAKMDALDEPGVVEVVVVKPSRSGGTTVAENYLGKMIQFGPMGDVGWYLGSGGAVKEYCERVVKPMFEDNAGLGAQIGSGRSDNNDTRKRVAGHLIEWLPANDAAFRNREFVFGVADESDGWSKFSETPGMQLEARQKNVGKRAKRMIMSHPDKGWRAGTAAEWVNTSRGIFVMKCVECDRFASAHATKFWPDVPEFKLWWQQDLYETKKGKQRLLRKREQLDPDERMALAESTAGMLCPHCGVVLDDEQRFAMVDEAGLNDWWMHRGQTLDIERGIMGEPDAIYHTKRGFWDHGLMLKNSPAVELATALEEALTKYERAGGKKSKELREVMSKKLGEIYEGKTGIEGVTAADLRKRSKASEAEEEGEAVLPLGMFPAEALFITAAVDVGLGKFDVSFRAWDLESRSWWLDRLTIRQRQWKDGRWRDIRTRDRIEDWDVLIADVIERTFPIVGHDGLAMPVAAVAIDVSDGNVTWKGREFARRCLTKRLYWGRPSKPWSRVRLIQGSPSAKAPEIPIRPRDISKDEQGKPTKPLVQEWTLGAHKLKELALERLAVTDDGPGHCYFAADIASNYYDEYFNEPLIDGKFERQGPNESLDLFGYEEAVRLMLRPDRKDIRWNDPDKRPVWARPVSLQSKGGDLAAEAEGAQTPANEGPKPKDRPRTLDRFASLNGRNR